ncbi:MAG: sel1 repeat family protein [Hahellaceae bacterium]|nr:sel1 repeat family protein [Hahellaceae bacterium]
MSELKKLLEDAARLYDEGAFEKAFVVLEPMAEQEIPEALGLIGLMYQLGQGTPVNGKKAVKNLLRAAELGQGVAAHNLGSIYAMGIDGVAKDKEKSSYYYRLAKTMGAQFAPDDFYN